MLQLGLKITRTLPQTNVHCANASGLIKLPLVLIVNSKKPCCFRQANQEKFPLSYKNKKNAWMNVYILESRFKEYFVPEIRRRLADLGQEKKSNLDFR